MKIIYIANVRIPTEKAHGIQIMKMCEAFSMAGADTELLLPWRFNNIKDGAFKYYDAKNNFKIRKLPSLDLIPLSIPYIGFWIQSLSFSISVFFYLLFKKADYIYSRDILLLFILSLFKNNLVYEAHYLPEHFGIYKGTLKRIKGLAVITQKLKELYQNKGINAKRILLVPDGVDLKRFQILDNKKSCRIKLNLPQDKKIILYTGHLYKWKGTQVLADASQYLNNNYLTVFVGGTKKDEKEFRETNKGFNNILIIGHRPYSEMPYWLRAADVLILPNSGKEKISRYYTSPLKMFEYMASQRPIVASDLPSIREILNKKNAILVKPDNPKNLAEGINIVLKDFNVSDKISKQVVSDVNEYSWIKRAKNIIKFINEL